MLRFDMEPRAGYVYATLSGELSLAAGEAVLREILQAAARYRQPRILMDCSRLHGTWSAEERIAFGAFMAAEQERMAAQFEEMPRVAIYAVAPLMDPSRLAQTAANNRGARTRSSDSLQELLSWLGV